MSVAGGHRDTAPPTIALRLAWGRYLDETRAAAAQTYELVEQLGWQRLRAELPELGRPAPDAAEQP